MAHFLLRFGEIGVKSRSVRRRFIDKLGANIRRSLQRAGVDAEVETSWSRLYVTSDDADGVEDVLGRTFGIVSFSRVHLAEADPDRIADRAVDLLQERFPEGEIGAFAVRARRHGSHDFSSRDIGVVVGAAVEEAFDAPVDLDDPDTEVFVEVRDNSAYVFFEKIDGPGGLPVGSQGRVALAWGPGAALTGWLLLKRGVELVPVVPEGRKDQVKPLACWTPGLSAAVLDAPDDVAPAMWIVLADEEAGRRGCDAVACGVHLDEGFAPRLKALSEVLVHPLLTPLAGLDDAARADLADRTGLVDDAAPPPEPLDTPFQTPTVDRREVEL